MLSLTPTTVKLDGALTLSGDVLPLRDVTGNKVAFAFSPVAADAGTPFTLEAPASIDGMTPITFDVIAPPAVTGVFEVVVTIPDCGDYTMPDQVTVTR